MGQVMELDVKEGVGGLSLSKFQLWEVPKLR